MFSKTRTIQHRSAAIAFVATLAFVSLLGTGPLPTVPGAQAGQAFGQVQVDGDHTAACPDGGASTIQAAVDCALPGATIYISPGTYNEEVVIGTSGLTLCSHVGGPLCAIDVETAHWQKSSSSTWEAAPAGAFGKALRINGIGSTSLFPPAGLALTDVFALSFDLFAENSTCGAGSPRIAFGIDTDGDGQRDGNVFTYGSASGSCTPGTWMHVDLVDDPGAYWASGAFGGPNQGTVADAQAAIEDAAAANGKTADIVAINLQVDHSPSAVTWVDNHRVNNWLLAEPNDELCFFDPTQSTCRHTNAVADTIVSSAGTATIRILAHDVTIRGLSVRAGALSESNGIYVGTASGGSYRDIQILDNDVRTTGLGESGITGRFDNGLIEGNSVQGFRQGVYLRTHGKSVTVLDNTLTNNGEGVLTYGYSPRIENNTISGSLIRGIGIANITSTGTGNVPVLFGNTFRGQSPVLGFRDTVTDMHVDGRFNDWGAYTRSDIEASMENLASGNTVDTRCYRNAAGNGYVCPPSAVTFTANPDPAQWNRVMTFVADVTGGTSEITARTWTFGDGTTGTGATAGHVYGASGTFDVTYTIQDADGYQLQATRTVTTINDAPVFTTLQDQVVDAGQRMTLRVDATDPDADAVVVQAGDIPVGATLSGPAASRTFAWTPTETQIGTHAVSFTATDGDLTTMHTVMLTVSAPLETSRVTLKSVGPFVRNASPGELVTFDALVKNEGSEAQNVTFEPAGLAAWNVTVPAPVTVAAGDSVQVSFTAVVPAQMASGYMGIKTGSGATAATVQYLVRTPVSLQVALDDAPTIGGAVTGTVTARFLDGTPVSDAAVSMRQTPALATALATSDDGFTDASGTYAFTMPGPSASLPGTHELTTTLGWAGGTWSKRTTYSPGV